MACYLIFERVRLFSISFFAFLIFLASSSSFASQYEQDAQSCVNAGNSVLYITDWSGFETSGAATLSALIAQECANYGGAGGSTKITNYKYDYTCVTPGHGGTSNAKAMCSNTGCPSGQTVDPLTGICAVPAPACTAGQTSQQVYGSCIDLDGDGVCDSGSIVTFPSMCVGGCTVDPVVSNPSAISCYSYLNADGTYGPATYCDMQYSTTGASCTVSAGTPAPIVPAPTACPAGTVAGTFNNKNLCLPSAIPKPPTTTTTTGGSQPPAGTTVTNNIDGSTTTITTINNGDGTSTTTTTTSKPPGTKAELAEAVEDYCSKNPSALACKTPDDFCEKNPESLSCMKAGTPEDVVLGESNISFSVTPVSVGSAGSCPADIPLPKGMSFSFAPMCTYANALKPLILASAWLTAGLIAFGFKGD